MVNMYAREDDEDRRGMRGSGAPARMLHTQLYTPREQFYYTIAGAAAEDGSGRCAADATVPVPGGSAQ